ncbi:TPM domain-containing protein [Pseudochryseolinea flava]|uniref:YgcG family protein n=1 Tax=Pseudochryseolinea flava TaxID=2059302 RepID=A0A364Y7Q0_9BACT|nr:TPM domain-containing protein [Pseudochryseolinea flava]RAW03136.1 YgcG family protein [Pseudochryseolinea flava]
MTAYTKRIATYASALALLMLTLFLFVERGYSQERGTPQRWDHRVKDEAGVLSADALATLESMLIQHEDSTSNQIAILIIKSLDGKVLEEYSMQVAHDELQLGSKKNDNGVLLLIAIDDHKMRIEVGKGLEGALTDALSSRIIRNEIAPFFRQDNYDDGVIAGTTAIIKAVQGEYTAEESVNESHELSLAEKIGIGAFIFGVLGIFTVVALLIPDRTGWFLYAFLIPFYAVFPWVVLGLVGGGILLTIYLIAFPIARVLIGKTQWAKNFASQKPGSRRSGSSWSSGSGWSSGSSSSSWSRGSSSGGGFSGGGGSFGGGGSSGSW